MGSYVKFSSIFIKKNVAVYQKKKKNLKNQ